MKIKQILVTTGLAALLSIGAGVGIAANKGASSVKAGNSTEENHTIYVAVSTATVESESYADFNVRVNTNIGDGGTWRQNKLTNIGDTTTYEGMTVFAGVYVEKYDGVDAMQIQLYDGNKWIEEKQPVSKWTKESFENKLFNYTTGEWATGYVPPAITYRTVTKYAVKDGTLDSTPLSSDSTVIDGNKYPAPAAPTVTGYHFEGWFSDEDCLNAWDDETIITADTPIYAKLTTIDVDSFVYWVDKDSTALTNVYFWGEYQPVEWPGTALSKYLVSDVLYYAGEGKLYRIPVPSSASYKMILNGDNTQSYDIDVTPRSLLYTWYDTEYSKYAYSSVDGTAAGFVAEVEKLRNRVEADPSKNVLQYSICGVDPLDAQGFYNMYYEFPENVKESIDKSYTYTYEGSYDGTNVPSETNITFDKIMLALKTVAENNHLAVKGSSLFFMIEAQESNNMIMIIVISASATMLLATALLIIKKRKSHK